MRGERLGCSGRVARGASRLEDVAGLVGVEREQTLMHACVEDADKLLGLDGNLGWRV